MFAPNSLKVVMAMAGQVTVQVEHIPADIQPRSDAVVDHVDYVGHEEWRVCLGGTSPAADGAEKR